MDRTDVENLIEDRLKTIAKQNGYKTDIGSAVTTWRVVPAEEEALNIVSEVERYDYDSAPVGKKYAVLSVALTGVVDGGNDEGAKALSDLEKCLGQDETFGGVFERIELEGGHLDVMQNKKVVCGYELEINVVYLTPRWRV